MKREDIEVLLKDFKDPDGVTEVKQFSAYIIRLLTEKEKGSQELKNPWMTSRKADQMAELFRRVHKLGLTFDGVHVTLQSVGVSFDFQSYKKRLFINYPESKIDVSLVYKADDFTVSKESGSVEYHHGINSLFDAKKDEDIIGGYCIIKNKRGDFLTLLSKDDIEKRRNVARTQAIWAQWFQEMCLKTVVKRGCSFHFNDDFQDMEALDNEQYDLDKDNTIPPEEQELKKLVHQVSALLEKNDEKESCILLLQEARTEGNLSIAALKAVLAFKGKLTSKELREILHNAKPTSK